MLVIKHWVPVTLQTCSREGETTGMLVIKHWVPVTLQACSREGETTGMLVIKHCSKQRQLSVKYGKH